MVQTKMYSIQQINEALRLWREDHRAGKCMNTVDLEALTTAELVKKDQGAFQKYLARAADEVKA